MTCDIILRREKLVSKMSDNSVAIFFSAPETIRSNDTHYPYQQNSDFWYLTHFDEPEAALLLIKESNNRYQTILFNRSKDPLAETWTGYRLGQDAAQSTLNVDKAYPFELIMEQLPNMLNGKQAIYHATQQYRYADDIVNDTILTLRRGARKNFHAPQSVIDWRPIVYEMRLFKSPSEIKIMQQAAKITAQAHVRAMQICKPDMYEYQLEAEILHEFSHSGARYPAYNTIVGSGNNGCILHYENNSDRLKNGDLVLIDAGCEYQHYAADITRTFPVNGKFSQAQKDIYNLVLKAQQKAIELLKPGTSIEEVNEQVIRILLKGLIKLDIIAGDLDKLIEEKAYLPYYMHGLGHWLGIDVHDVGDDKTPPQKRKLEPGIILTIEPGLYINCEAQVPCQYQGIGIRIEDNILITDSGNVVLTDDVPKLPEEIETLMNNAR